MISWIPVNHRTYKPIFLLVFSKIKEKHTKYFKIICKKFQENVIMLSPKKIEVEQTTIKFLGLSQIGLKLQNHIFFKIKEFP